MTAKYGGVLRDILNSKGVFNDLSRDEVSELHQLDQALYRHWELGRHLIIAWALSEEGLQILLIPHDFIALSEYSEEQQRSNRFQRKSILGDAFIHRLLSGQRRRTSFTLKETARRLNIPSRLIEVDTDIFSRALMLELAEELVRRYSINYVHSRAVALFDIVGFSLLRPFEQMAQLNSLCYSINAAQSQLLSRKLKIDFARTTTGDGFYLWNRDQGLDANVNLYHLMHLVLADNALAFINAKGNTVPTLRTGFHIGSHYEFFQAEGLSPGLHNFIVGDVTIELARLIDQARPGQILIGEFNVELPQSAKEYSTQRVTTQSFIKRMQFSMEELCGLEFWGEPIDDIKCYLTGEPNARGQFNCHRFNIVDKHGLSHPAYNAKVNIYRKKAKPIFLGLQEKRLRRVK